jgi:hypothetical protein
MSQDEPAVTANPLPTRFWPWAILWAALFALAHTQSPEYYSNQHQYYLHGFAQASVGNLKEDWLANTQDPTPAYSWGVAAIYRLAGPFAFQAIYFVLLGVYFESIRRMITAIPGMPIRGPALFLFLALFLAAHAAILRVAVVRLTGVDYPWYLQAGVAAQYLLGPGLQPSVFGVLLVTSLTAFVNGRAVLAAGLAAAAAGLHSTYLLSAGLLVLTYLIILYRDGRNRTASVAGSLALVIVLPVLIFNARTFLAGDSVHMREAQRIFAHVRIPHHTEFNRWFDWIAAIQFGVMALGLVLIRRTRLFVPLAIPTLVCTALTVVQVLTDSDALALLFPWRFSAVLMPISVAIIFGKLAALVAGRTKTRAVTWACGSIAVGIAIGGIVVMACGLGYYTNDSELPLLNYVRDHKQSGEVYLLPAKFATIKKENPAGQSKTFAPPVRTGDVGIPVDMQRFRLLTGAPIYVDFKAPPYTPAEVLEWHARMSNVQRWYKDRDWDRTGAWREIRAAGITHVITTADKDVKCGALTLIWSDENYRLYRVEGE